MEKVKSWLKKYGQWIIIFISAIVILEIMEDIFTNDLMKYDELAYYIIMKYIRSDFLTPIMKFITSWGSASTLIILTILLLILLKNKREKACLVINLFTITILNQLLKFIVQRPRPSGYNLIDEAGYSFPSGHSMISMAFYGYLIYLIYRYTKNNKIKYTLIGLLLLLISMIGFSRIYLGVHYLSDVISGFLISVCYLILFIRVSRKYIEKGAQNEK